MSEVRRQQKRIEHMTVTVGKPPSVLDVEPANWDALITELKSDNRFRGCIKHNFPMWKPDIAPGPIDDDETAEPKIVELFGVRFCKGRV